MAEQVHSARPIGGDRWVTDDGRVVSLWSPKSEHSLLTAKQVVVKHDTNGVPWVLEEPDFSASMPSRNHTKLTSDSHDGDNNGDTGNEQEEENQTAAAKPATSKLTILPTSVAKTPTNKLTIMPAQDLAEIRFDIIDFAKDNQELRHQMTMLQNQHARAVYERQLFWDCGMEWARRSLEWQMEVGRLRGRVQELEDTIARLQAGVSRESAGQPGEAIWSVQNADGGDMFASGVGSTPL